MIYQYMAIFFNFSPTSSHLHLLQIENCDSNSRLVVDEDDNDKLRLERVKLKKLNFHPLEVMCGGTSNWVKITNMSLL